MVLTFQLINDDDYLLASTDDDVNEIRAKTDRPKKNLNRADSISVLLS